MGLSVGSLVTGAFVGLSIGSGVGFERRTVSWLICHRLCGRLGAATTAVTPLAYGLHRDTMLLRDNRLPCK